MGLAASASCWLLLLGVSVSGQRIPEPMVFDLVRPLDAKKGELEVNTLFQLPLRREARSLAWAPEIEYAFADGQAIELEFPIEGGRLTDLKLAVQGRLGVSGDERIIHGWQFIAKARREGGDPSFDALHMFGYRFNERWSVFSMQGVRRSRTDFAWLNKGIYNLSVFNELNRRATIGVETNFVFGCPGCAQALIMPQAHLEIGGNYRIQFGLGLSKDAGRKSTPALGLRLIREF